MSFLARRAGFYLLAAWLAASLNFLVPRLMPGDPASIMFARFQGELSPEAMEALRETFGFTSEPLWRQYLQYLGSLATGDFGTSVAFFPAPVGEVVAGGLAWTVVLAGTALVVAFALGSVLGAVAAWRRGGWVDSVVPPVLALLGAFPYFWLAMLAAFVFGFVLDWFPLRHAYGPGVEPGFSWAFFSSVVRHAFLPASTLVVASLGGWMLTMRNTMVGVLGDDHVAYARARGLSSRRVFVHYAMRNALLPSLASFGMALGFVLSGALLTEIVFAYPGQGYLLITAVRAQDHPLMQALFLTITLAVLGASFLVDVATAALDPRTR